LSCRLPSICFIWRSCFFGFLILLCFLLQDDKSANSGYVKFSRDYLALDWHIVDFAPSKLKVPKHGLEESPKLPDQLFEIDYSQDVEDKEPTRNAETKVFPRKDTVRNTSIAGGRSQPLT
jgi:hypothetical protein